MVKVRLTIAPILFRVTQVPILVEQISVSTTHQVSLVNHIGLVYSVTSCPILLMSDGLVRFFVLVDNRDITAPMTPQESLAHWPTVEAWWVSRLAMHGPAREQGDLIFVPIDQSAGLQHVHPTWAGTFVLAALTFLFPGAHVVLLDSDRVPMTLFEVADLWKKCRSCRMDLTNATSSSLPAEPDDSSAGG